MNNKGFTFVELMGVIVILAIITTIAVSSYNGIKRTTNENLCKQRVKQIEILAVDYASDNNIINETNYEKTSCDEQYETCNTECDSELTSCTKSCETITQSKKVDMCMESTLCRSKCSNYNSSQISSDCKTDTVKETKEIKIFGIKYKKSVNVLRPFCGNQKVSESLYNCSICVYGGQYFKSIYYRGCLASNYNYASVCKASCKATGSSCKLYECKKDKENCSLGNYSLTSRIEISSLGIDADDEILINPINDEAFSIDNKYIYVTKSTNGTYEANYDYTCEYE